MTRATFTITAVAFVCIAANERLGSRNRGLSLLLQRLSARVIPL